MPVLDNVKHPPMVNLQQCYVEQYILDELSKSPLATVRWSSAVKAVENCGDRVKVQVATPDGDYELESDWLIACDGARSVIRSSLGLRMEGTSYEGRYIVADVRLATDLPPGRRVWFDSAGNPDSTIILHRQPDNIWRIDYQLRDDEDLIASWSRSVCEAGFRRFWIPSGSADRGKSTGCRSTAPIVFR